MNPDDLSPQAIDAWLDTLPDEPVPDHQIDTMVARIRALQAPLRIEHMLHALQLAYRKHHLEAPRIGWDELDDVLTDALSEVMGDKAFRAWLAAQCEELKYA